jgi:very-short-patch-repair endonuclease
MHVRAKNGCPKCGNSYNENLIVNFFEENNIIFESEKTFKDLKLKGKLRFDFYIPKLNLVVEFDGKQHFEPVRFRGISEEVALEKFKHIQKTDKIKNEYCNANNINIVRISYFDNIYSKLKEIMNDYKKEVGL